MNKQGVRIREYVTELIRERLDSHVTQLRKKCNERLLKHSGEKMSGQSSEAEKLASEADPIQNTPVVAPPTDTEEQRAALAANFKGLAFSLRQGNETEDQAFERIKSTKYLTQYNHADYAPFYETEYQFGKHILRVNTAHPFYQKVWQPLAEAAKQAAVTVHEDGDESADVGGGIRRALLGYQLLLSLARTQTQMTGGDAASEKNQIFRNLRKSWSDVLVTQLCMCEVFWLP